MVELGDGGPSLPCADREVTRAGNLGSGGEQPLKLGPVRVVWVSVEPPHSSKRRGADGRQEGDRRAEAERAAMTWKGTH